MSNCSNFINDMNTSRRKYKSVRANRLSWEIGFTPVFPSDHLVEWLLWVLSTTHWNILHFINVYNVSQTFIYFSKLIIHIYIAIIYTWFQETRSPSFLIFSLRIIILHHPFILKVWIAFSWNCYWFLSNDRP